MTEKATIRIAENTPEQVAYKLFDDIRVAENRQLANMDRQYILDTYAECMEAVRGERDWRANATDEE